MFTPKELIYINTSLQKEHAGVYARYCEDYEVAIKPKGQYSLCFDSQEKAIQFEQRLILDDTTGISISDGIILLNKKDDDHLITIKCGNNQELANRLTKYLRKQLVRNRNLQEMIRANRKQLTTEESKQDIENIGVRL